MNSVFEKALLSLLLYTQNHSFIAHDFFFKIFIPILFPYFLRKALESLSTCSLVVVQLRKAHLHDLDNEKLLTGNSGINTHKIVSNLKDSQCFNGGQNLSRFKIEAQILMQANK